MLYVGCESEDTSLTLDLEQLKDAKVTDYEIGDDRLGDEEWNVITEATYVTQCHLTYRNIESKSIMQSVTGILPSLLIIILGSLIKNYQKYFETEIFSWRKYNLL